MNERPGQKTASAATVGGAGRVVLVTGGSRGIGLATARQFAALGDRVAVTCRTIPHDVPDADSFLWLTADITDTAQVDAAVSRIEEVHGPVEVLVANAGITADGLSIRMADDDFARVIDTNLVGTFRVARRVSQKMLRLRRGRIVFVSSVVGATGQAGQANYAASKAGLVGLARSMARELASRSITVNVVAPGPTATDMWAEVSDEHRNLIETAVPLGRVGTPQEIAATIVFVASEPAGYITGAVIPVDGGLGMGAI